MELINFLQNIINNEYFWPLTIILASIIASMILIKNSDLKDRDFIASEYEFWCGNFDEKNQDNTEKSTKQNTKD